MTSTLNVKSFIAQKCYRINSLDLKFKNIDEVSKFNDDESLLCLSRHNL